jgi:hypothetical protein
LAGVGMYACDNLWHNAAQPAPAAEPIHDLDTCPSCGGPADNGFDRCGPPNPYYCTKCSNPSERDELIALVREWRVALERIANDESGCDCEHDDAECCEEVGEYCAQCIAGKALELERARKLTEGK